jgi:sec-independent protein translocase protein TatB
VLNLDPAKLLIIAVVAVILLGPDKLPQVARQAGAAWRTFNNFRHRMESEVRCSIPDLPSSHDIARLARSPSALLEHLSNMSTDGTSTASENGTAVSGDVTAVVEGAAVEGTVVNGAVMNGAVVNGAVAPENSDGALPSVSAHESPTEPPPRRPSEGHVSGDPGLN